MAKVNLEIVGKDKGGSAVVKGVTKSIISAQLAIEGIKIATKALIDVGKKSIDALRQQEQILAKLEVQTNGNTVAIEQWTSKIQDVTNIGDEASQKIASLGLSMGITQDKLEEATKGAIGLSESLGIDLNSAMKMVALSNEGEFNMLARYIPALRTASTEAEKQAIVQQAMANGFDLARARADTFTGRLEQLENTQGDTLEVFGNLVSIVGKDFVEGMIEGQKAIQGFLQAESTVTAITGTFAILKDVFNEIKTVLSESLRPIFEEVTDLLASFSKEGDSGKGAMVLLAGATTALASGLTIISKVIAGVIETFKNFVEISKSTGSVISTVFKIIKGEATFDDLSKSVDKARDSFSMFAKDSIENVKDLVSTTVNEFKDFGNETSKSAEKYSKSWEDATEKVKKQIKDTAKEGKDNPPLNPDDAEKNSKQYSEKFKTGLNTALSLTKEILGGIQGLFNDHYNNLLQQNSNWQENQIDQINSWIERELDAHNIRVETREEQLQREIDALNASLGTMTTNEERARIENEIRDKQSELKRQQILAEGEKKKAEIQKAGKEKETRLKKKQHEENKAFQIAQIWINTAAGIVGAWAQGISQLGPIAGAIVAGVMTAALLATAGAQTAAVSSQTFHGQEGGIVPNGTTSGDRAVTFMNKGEALLRNDDFNALVEMARGGGNGNGDIFISEATIIANNPSELSEQLLEIQRQERARR